MVLLAEYQAPPPVDEIRVGNSLALVPRLPRARRGPASKAKPFDAAEIYYIDSQLADITQWRITALLEGTKRILAWEEDDVADRTAQIGRLRDELERRGLDFEQLVRQGLVGTIGARIYAGAVAARVMGDGFSEDISPIARRAKSWISVLGLDSLDIDNEDDLAQKMISAVDFSRVRIIVNWLRAAQLEDIIDLVPPRGEISAQETPDDNYSPENLQRYLWIIERFTTTYLHEWSLSSLKLEWKYQHGLLTPPCTNADMATFSVAENELAKQIAARSVQEEQDGVPTSDISAKIGAEALATLTASALIPVAISLLNAGHRREAAAIFESSAQLNPRDPVAFNNWAFCLMPEAPEKSLELLERAAGIGNLDELLLTGNRLWCLLRLNRLSTALSVSDTVIGSIVDRQRHQAHMWSLKGDVVEDVDDLRVYVLDLIASVVERSADASISERWNPLLETVRASISWTR